MDIRKTDGLGMGDFKMLAWLGAFWGWGAMLGILFGASLLAVAFALPLLLMGRAKGQSMLPLGCLLALATFPIVFYGPALWAGYGDDAVASRLPNQSLRAMGMRAQEGRSKSTLKTVFWVSQNNERAARALRIEIRTQIMLKLSGGLSRWMRAMAVSIGR